MAGITVLLVHDEHDPLYAEANLGIQDVLRERGHTLLHVPRVPAHNELGETYAHLPVDGIILGPSPGGGTAPLQNLPVVGLARAETRSGRCSVSLDDTMAGVLAIEHLLRRPVRTIVYMAPAPLTAGCADRLSGARHAIGCVGSSAPALVVKTVPEATAEAANDLTSSLLDGHAPPDAFLCAGTPLSIGTVRALRSRGLDIPRDVAVTVFEPTNERPHGCDTVLPPAYRLGRLAAELITEECRRSDTHHHRSVRLQPRIVAPDQ